MALLSALASRTQFTYLVRRLPCSLPASHHYSSACNEETERKLKSQMLPDGYDKNSEVCAENAVKKQFFLCEGKKKTTLRINLLGFLTLLLSLAST
jgi:hypothetical protein